MPLADLEIVEVVRRRDLHRAGAFFRVGIVVADDRNTPPDQRQQRHPADQVLQAFVVGMHRDGDVAEHRFRPRRRHDDELVAAFDRIFDVPEVPLDLDLLHFKIRDRGLELGIPIDEALVPVDEARAIKLDKDFCHRPREAFVHGEALARPVARGAQPLQLADDGAAGFRLPFPHALDESLAAHFAAARLLTLHQLALDHGLGGDAGMVGSRLPQHVLAAHALKAAQDVLQRIVERVTHVQRTRHVGRRNDDAVGLRRGAFRPSGTKGAGSLPRGVNAALDRAGHIPVFDHCCFAAAISRASVPLVKFASTSGTSRANFRS